MNRELYKILFDQNELYKISSYSNEEPEVHINEKTIILLPEQISKKENDLLKNILSSVNLNLSDSRVFENLEDTDRITSTDGKLIFSFGARLPKKIENAPLYEYLKIDNNKYIICDTLNRLDENRDLKMKLWSILKSNF